MKIRCSGLARPMVCAGYRHLELPSYPSHPGAAEGTAAGEYLEKLLLNQPIGATARNGEYFTDEMKNHAKPIAAEILRRANGAEIRCEQRIDWKTRSGITISGSYDISFAEGTKRLNVEDLKYGWGIVEVKENWQLLGYAIGEVLRRGVAFEEISLKIHQPRPHHEDGPEREWLLSYAELLEYKEKIEVRMEQLAAGDRTLQTSSACKYCPGAGEACPAFSRLFYRALEVSTEFVQDSLTPQEIATQLDQVRKAQEVIKIKSDSLNQLATLRITEGKIIPGYDKMAKYGNRAWKKCASAKSIELMTGVKATEEVFLSPAKLEKLGVSKELVASLTERTFRGQELKKVDTSEIGNNIFGNQSPLGGN